jgi:isoleucyl-tRNA synthetase
LARLMAPIMVFTAEEIWHHLPPASDREASIHLAQLPQVDETLRDASLARQWQAIKMVRAEVTKALEAARSQKIIGHSLDAAVTLGLSNEYYEQLAPYEDELHSILIVSQARLQRGVLEGAGQNSEIEGIAVQVAPAAGQKCNRCWVYDPTVGEHTDHPTICGRCYASLETMGQLGE